MSRRNSVRRIRNLLHTNRATGTAFASSPSTSANSSYFAIARRVGKFISSLLIAVFVAAVLMGAVYGILPKTSFINLHSTPDTVQFEHFHGQYEVRTSVLDVNRRSKISNNSDISVRISGDNSLTSEHYENSYELKKGELEITSFLVPTELNELSHDNVNPYLSNLVFSDDKDSFAISQLAISGPHLLTFNKEVICRENIRDEIIEIRGFSSNNSVTQHFRFSPRPVELRDSNFVYGNTPASVRISLDNGATQFTLNSWDGWTKICIGGNNVLAPMNHVSIEFSSLDDEIPELILSSERVYYNQAYGPTTISFDGKCKSFSEKSQAETDTLKQTYLNVQKEYDVGLLHIAGIAADSFEVESKLSDEKNEIHVSGEAKEISMGGTSLNFNFMTFLYENLSAVLFAIFGAMLSTYLPMLLPEEKRKKE